MISHLVRRPGPPASPSGSDTHPAGGWAIPDSLRAPYIPGPEQVFSAWFPAPQGAAVFGTLGIVLMAAASSSGNTGG